LVHNDSLVKKIKACYFTANEPFYLVKFDDFLTAELSIALETDDVRTL